MLHTQSNHIICNAPRGVVYEIIRNSSCWPRIFEPCISVKVKYRSTEYEQILIKALVNNVEMSWESKRTFLNSIYSIESEMLNPMPLVKSMHTNWNVFSINDQQSVLLLEHNYHIADDVKHCVEGVDTKAQAVEFLKEAIDSNSRKELSNIKTISEKIANTDSGEMVWDTHHSTVCNSNAQDIYKVITNIELWPEIFDACEKATVLKSNGNTDIVFIQANDKGNIMEWETHRTYHDDIFKVDFHLPKPMPFLKNMSGTWRVVPLSDQKSLLSVNRHFELLDDVSNIREDIKSVAEAKSYISNFIEENAENEMISLKSFVEKKTASRFKFINKYYINCPPEKVFDVFSDVCHWPEVLPHCNDVKVLYDDGRDQEFIMEVSSTRGAIAMRSIRNCDKDKMTITYFQPSPPDFLDEHRGEWVFRSFNGGTEVISEHKVSLNVKACSKSFHDDNITDYKHKVKELIAGNSHKTFLACEDFLLNSG
ncbi:MAG: hypothetical protein K0U29_01280 [Gammaproteobacteria bacterium]|nr:hypothetical protein [Gammaproteobacteria bacterium]MCH9743539.1 hypothetical protein [Gammaproteobacteria bacterium]